MQPSSMQEFYQRMLAGSPGPMPTGEGAVHRAVCMLDEGETIEVDEETFDYFLDVLPLRYQGPGCFAFAEGAEPFRFFWKRSCRYFCRQLSWDESHFLSRLFRGGDHAS